MFGYSEEATKVIKGILDIDNLEMTKENMKGFFEYGFGQHSYPEMFKKFASKRFCDTKRKNDIAEYTELDWCAVNDLIDELKHSSKIRNVYELNNNNVLIIF